MQLNASPSRKQLAIVSPTWPAEVDFFDPAVALNYVRAIISV